MTSDHLTAEELIAYQSRILAPVELLRVSDHLAECSECREKVARKEVNPSEPVNLSYEELTEYLDENIDPLRRRELSEKLQRSPASRLELKDLVIFRDAVNAIPVSDFGKTSSPEDRILIFPSAIMRWALPLAAAIALTSAGVWWSMRNSGNAANAITLRDGNHVFSVKSNGRIVGLPAVSEELLESIVTAIREGKLTISPTIDSLASGREVLAGAPNEPSRFRLLGPVATAVRENIPRFRWSAQPAATSYRVHLADSRTGEAVMTGKTDGAQTEWTPAEPLLPGQTYQWQVEALRNDEVIERAPKPPEPEARFEILPSELQQQLTQSEMRANGSHIVLAVMDAKAGLLDDAVRELQAFAQENPGSKIPTRLLRQIEDTRRGKSSR